MPASPDGNCMFNAISIYTTASAALPNGTDKHHNEVRQKCCDYIVKERNGKLAELIAKRGLDTDEKFDAYIKKKRATTGERFTWSDNITANAIAATQGKGPIMQITYPRYIDGVERPDLEPKFLILTKSGDKTKLPIFIHYNGINHYNAIVPAEWGSGVPRVLQMPPKGLQAGPRPNGMPFGKAPFGHLFNAEVPKVTKPAISPKSKGMVPRRNIAASPKRNVAASPKRNLAASPKRVAVPAPTVATKNMNAAAMIPKPRNQI